MNRAFLFAVFFFFALHLQAQSHKALKLSADTSVYISVEQAPDYPGGMEKFSLCIFKNLKLPEGYTPERMAFEMIIEKDGSISHAKMTSQSNKTVGDQVIDMLNKSPRWISGINKGKPVRVLYSFPISCILPGTGE